MGRYNVSENAVFPGSIYTAIWDRIAEFGQVRLIYPSVGEGKIRGRELVEIICRDSTPLGRPQDPEDVAALVGFPISDQARNITDQAINVDVGQEVH